MNRHNNELEWLLFLAAPHHQVLSAPILESVGRRKERKKGKIFFCALFCICFETIFEFLRCSFPRSAHEEVSHSVGDEYFACESIFNFIMSFGCCLLNRRRRRCYWVNELERRKMCSLICKRDTERRMESRKHWRFIMHSRGAWEMRDLNNVWLSSRKPLETFPWSFSNSDTWSMLSSLSAHK